MATHGCVSLVLPMTSKKQSLLVPFVHGYLAVNFGEVAYLEAQGSYSRIHCLKGGPIMVSRTLGKIEAKLPMNVFLRIHHSYIVNLTYVLEFHTDDGGYVIMKYGDTRVRLPVSRRRHESVKQKLRSAYIQI